MLWEGQSGILSVMCGEGELVEVTVCVLWGVGWRRLVSGGVCDVEDGCCMEV